MPAKLRDVHLIGSAAVAGGVAFGIYAYKRAPTNPLLKGLGDGQAALTPYVRLDQSGVTIITPRADVGQGAYSVLAALVAEELDLAWEDIKVEPGPPSAATTTARSWRKPCRSPRPTTVSLPATRAFSAMSLPSLWVCRLQAAHQRLQTLTRRCVWPARWLGRCCYWRLPSKRALQKAI